MLQQGEHQSRVKEKQMTNDSHDQNIQEMKFANNMQDKLLWFVITVVTHPVSMIHLKHWFAQKPSYN